MGLACMLAAGCQPAPWPTLTASDHIRGGGLDEPFADHSIAVWKADPSRLPIDIRRSFRDLDWGRMYIRHTPAAGQQQCVVRSSARLVSDRTATIVAWGIDEQTIAVAVRVGLFGDRKQEQHFVKMLAKLLAGKPVPRRGGTFEL